MTLWFGKSPSLDEEIRDRFGELVSLAADGELDAWTADPFECLALVILLDQFPRNIFRCVRVCVCVCGSVCVCVLAYVRACERTYVCV